jgi:hypothetical protein
MPFEKGKAPRGGRFQPGQSGNPGGKPKAIVEVAAAARARTVEAIETLTTIMRDKKATASARVSAAVAMLERGWGKAPQSISVKRDPSEMRTMTDDELVAIAAGIDTVADTETGSSEHSASTSNGKGEPH